MNFRCEDLVLSHGTVKLLGAWAGGGLFIPLYPKISASLC